MIPGVDLKQPGGGEGTAPRAHPKPSGAQGTANPRSRGRGGGGREQGESKGTKAQPGTQVVTLPLAQALTLPQTSPGLPAASQALTPPHD